MPIIIILRSCMLLKIKKWGTRMMFTFLYQFCGYTKMLQSTGTVQQACFYLCNQKRCQGTRAWRPQVNSWWCASSIGDWCLRCHFHHSSPCMMQVRIAGLWERKKRGASSQYRARLKLRRSHNGGMGKCTLGSGFSTDEQNWTIPRAPTLHDLGILLHACQHKRIHIYWSRYQSFQRSI